jgi:hypothetical protein
MARRRSLTSSLYKAARLSATGRSVRTGHAARRWVFAHVGDVESLELKWPLHPYGVKVHDPTDFATALIRTIAACSEADTGPSADTA